MRLAEIIATALLLAACGKGTDKDGPAKDSGVSLEPILLSGPTLDSPSELVPLTRVLTLQTRRPVRVEATIGDGTESKTWRFAELSTDHAIPLIGFKAARDWTVTVELVEEDQTRHTLADLRVAAPSVPSIYPTYEVRAHDAAASQPGYTLLNLRSRGAASVPTETWTLLDEAFEPVWLSMQQSEAKMAFQRADGLFMGLDKVDQFQGQFAVVRDLTGAVISEFHTDESWTGSGTHVSGTFAFHHDLIELPGGTFAALAKEPDGFLVNDFPINYDDPLDRMSGLDVNSDRIVEFDASGSVVSSLALGPLMDPGRIGYDSLDASFLDGRIDWTHANGLDYDPSSDAWIVSFRHQDAIVKIDRATGQLVWILANPANWGAAHEALRLAADGPLSWSYHQHSPDMHPDGDRLIVFDNGNWRASPWDGTPDPDDGPREMRARIVEFQIDESNRTVSQNWEFEPPDGFHSCPAVGGASYLPNGHVLATFGLVIAVNGSFNAELGFGDEAVRIMEFDPADNNRVVSDLWISVPRAVQPDGWQTFFSRRIDSPYGPGVLLPDP